MTGVIRTRHILCHMYLVIKNYGWRVFFRCLAASYSKQTFLEIVSMNERSIK